MDNKYITVVESEDGSTLKDVYLWDKAPKKVGDSFMNESDNICLKLPKNIATYILNSIGKNCTYGKQECFKINFEKVETENENSCLVMQSNDANTFFKENIKDFKVINESSAFYKICKRVSLQYQGKTKAEIFNKSREACSMAIVLNRDFQEIIHNFSSLVSISESKQEQLTLLEIYDIIEKLEILAETISTYGIIAEESTNSNCDRKRINTLTADEKIVKCGLTHVFKFEETIEKTVTLWKKLAFLLWQEKLNASHCLTFDKTAVANMKINIPKGE